MPARKRPLRILSRNISKPFPQEFPLVIFGGINWLWNPEERKEGLLFSLILNMVGKLPKTFFKNLEEIQPTQLYINSAKLSQVKAFFDPTDHSSYKAVPLKKLEGDIVFTDGHTRAFLAHLQGLTEIKAYWEQEDLNWQMYKVCVKWCKEEGIKTIADLEGKVIPAAQFKQIWIERCHSHDDYEKHRHKGSDLGFS